jgi:Fe-S oxidoreductase
MSKLKYEFLQAYYKKNKIPLRNYLLGKLPTLNKVGSIFAPLSNWIIQSSLIKIFMDKYLGITKNRSLPPFSNQTFTQWFNFNEQFINNPENQKSVIIFPDTFTNFNYPYLGKATVRIMQKLKYNVIVPTLKCCGRPMLSSGLIDAAKQNAKYNIDILYPLVQKGIKIVGIEPSCLLSFRDDYISLLGKRPEVEAIAKSTFLIEEFLEYSSTHDKTKLNFKTTDKDVLFHGHCHQKAIVGTKDAMNVLESIPGCNPSNLETGCCGMAGSFGYHKEHYELSMQIGQKSLFSILKSQEKDSAIITEGVSCRQQIQHGLNVKAKHLVEIIADSLY